MARFQRRLIQSLNSGALIAIGYKIRPSRPDLALVWDGKLRIRKFDWINGRYCGPHFEFEELRILPRAECHPELIAKYDRLRLGKTGRPRIDGLDLAIERAISKYPELADPKNKKRLAQRVQEEMQLMVGEKLISTIASERTILNALYDTSQRE
jgi:hypothetical protein